MRALVTGGAGYIGSHVVAALVGSGHEPIVLDNLSLGHAEAVGGVRLIEADVRDPEAVEQTLHENGIEAVIHLAGLKSPHESLANPGRYFDVNVAGSRTLLDAMARLGISPLVFSSSCAVYGLPERLPIDEDSRTVPTTPYGESKLLVERMLPWYRSLGVRSFALRYFNAAGAAADGSIGEDWTAAINLVPVVIRSALGYGDAVEVFGNDYPTPDGTAIRDYIHVVDLAKAHVRALEVLAEDEANGGVLNLGTGRGTSVAEVLAAVGRVVGAPVPHRIAPRRPGDPPAVWADTRRANELLGWRATHELDEIIDSAVRWHRGHPRGYA